MSIYLQIILAAFTSFLISFFAVPSIIKVAEIKNLFDCPDERKTHRQDVPTLGGIAIFAGFIFSVTFWAKQSEIAELQYIISALIIMFFMGIKDDVVNLVAYKKLFGQILASLIVIYFADIRLTSLYGIFDIHEIPYFVSLAITLVTFIGITNSFNLIDGIDTLAGTIGVLSTIIFGIWFTVTSYGQYAILSFSLTGCLLGFLWYNKTPARIFMGDTGSLVVGLINAILAVQFIEYNRVHSGIFPEYKIYSVPAVAISILIIPLFDTARVFILRTLQGRSPLSPDRNHIHHILVDLGYSHLKATGVLAALNFIIIALSFYLQSTKVISGELLLFINLSIMFVFSIYHTRKRRKLNKVKLIKSASDEKVINF